MTEDQLNALKIYIDAMIDYKMTPVFDNEIMANRATIELDEAMRTPSISRPHLSTPEE